MTQAQLQAGFEYPVRQAQQTFRTLLTAMSEPGRVLGVQGCQNLASLDAAGFAICQTLLDSDTSVWLGDAFANPVISDNLRFHCGTCLSSLPQQADFILSTMDSLPDLMSLRCGHAEYPDQSTTLFIQVARLEAQAHPLSTVLALKGPGIENQHILSIAPMSDVLFDYLIERPHGFPLGLDLVLFCEGRITAIPRTTHVEEY
ncbi:MAG: Alpha-D-ribose 1-methylphosphonate 5-triphosphate synthase subunit PhnH [Candidatus Celerinatantimonas neptuna]|nr:MAG: Alpha-D-ribose 1-methylphosphonate 5-triphosphate synthase subunit PhnH [Candidatus Celerinatantimonas neptuna]